MSFGVLAAWLALGSHCSALTPPPLPNINTNNIFVVTNATYGAVGDGLTTNTTAIQNAINAAAAASGGGTVEIPAAAGSYICGPLTMKSSVNLQVDSGAMLQMLPYGSWPGTTTFINGSSLHDVEISGSGKIDGQGAPWWAAFNSNSISRPNFINFSGCTTILIQDVTLQNPPTFHLMLKGNNKNITIQRIDINTDPNSPNTDGMDLGSTNMLIQNCHITDGDDNIEIGGSSALAAYITITNCMFGHGHGVSMGSLLEAGVSNVTVINCTFTNTDYAIRMKSDNDRGGVVQNLSYFNLGMTNIKYAPILVYSYYNSHGSPSNDGITPSVAATTTVASVSSTTPIWRNIVISNVTATAAQPGMIWARTELPASNITFNKLNITASDSSNGSFDLYSVRGLEIVDCQIHVPGGDKTYALFNAQTTFTNSTTGAGAITLDGFAVTNLLGLYNQPASLTDGTIFGAAPIALAASTLSDGTSLTLAGTTPVDFTLGTNPATVAVSGNLGLNSTLNIASGDGFGAGSYTLFTYTGSFSGVPVLGTTPPGFNYLLTNAASQLDLLVTATNGSSVAPTITTQPTNQTVVAGGGISFTVGVSGTAPFSYQWYFSTNTPLANATNSTFTILNAQTTNAGGYSVIVTNSAGSATSQVASLSVIVAPGISAQPTNQTVTAGQTAAFSVAATGTAPLHYQWYFNTNAALAGATNASLSVPNAQLTNAGSYSVIVTNTAGGATSQLATLIVNASPSITVQPADQTITVGQTASFSVTASGSAPLGYQWYFNTNSALPGATNSSLSILNAQTTNAGGYSVIVTNQFGAATSAVASLTVNAPITGIGTVILDDTWADANRTNTSLPTNSAWYASSSTSLTTATNAMTGTTGGTSSRSWWTYFTTNVASPVPLAVGETLKLTLSFSLTGVAPSNTGSALRIGLYDSSGGTRTIADGSSPGGANIRGYMLNMNLATVFGPSPLQLMVRTNLGSANLQSAQADYSSLNVGGPAAGSAGFSNTVLYTFQFSVTRNSNSLAIASSLASTTGWNISITATHTNSASPDYTSTFDTFAIRPANTTQTATNFIFTEIKVEKIVPATSVPPFRITAIQFLTPDLLALTWDAVPNAVYQVQSLDSLGQSNWALLGVVTSSLSSATFTNSGTGALPQRFYRVVNTP